MRAVESEVALDARQLRALRRIRRWTRLLDTSWTIPGTRFRVGLDPLLGLIPGVGDLATALASAWLVHEARRLGLPRPLLRRMALNVGLDALLGAVPVAGDLFDFAFRANTRNLALIERWLGAAPGDQRRSR